MREYTRWALQELVGGFEFEHIASDCMFSIGYKLIEVRGGAQDGGADAVIRKQGKNKYGEEVRFAYSTQKNWRSKLTQDFEKLGENIQINTFIFCTSQEISGANKEQLAIKFRQMFGVNLLIYDISQFVVWLDNTDWGNLLKKKYGLLSTLDLSSRVDFEECLRFHTTFNINSVRNLVRKYCNQVLTEIKYTVWLNDFLMRMVKLLSDSNSKDNLCLKKKITELIVPAETYLLIGEAGMGKTTALEFLTAYCSQLSSELELLFPVYINLSEIGTHNLFDLIKNEIKIRLPQVSYEDITALLKNTRVVLLLDALNEIEDRYFTEFHTDLRHLRKLIPLANIILTSRSSLQILQTQLEIAELIELNDEQLFQLMNRKSESKQNSIDLKTFKANTKNLLRNPFYASILSKTLYQEQSQDSVKLLSYFVSIRIKEITRYGISGESALLFLERLGYTCVLLRKTLFDFKFILKILERISDQHHIINVFGRDLQGLTTIGILKELRNSFTFSHQILQQFFAAKFLYRQYKSGKDIIQILEQTYLSGQGAYYLENLVWEEVAPMLCDLVDDPDSLILLMLDRLKHLSAICIGESTHRSEEIVKTAINRFSNPLSNDNIFCLGATKSILALEPLLMAFRVKERKNYGCFAAYCHTSYECSYSALHNLPRLTVEKAMKKMLKDKDKEISSRAKYFLSSFYKTNLIEKELTNEYNLKNEKEEIDILQCKVEIEKGCNNENYSELINKIEKIGTHQAEDILIDFLSNSDRDIRRLAALSLGNLGCQKAVRKIVNIFNWLVDEPSGGFYGAGKGITKYNRGSTWYRCDLLIALDKIGTSRVANALVDLLSSYNSINDYWLKDLFFHIITKYGDTFTLYELSKCKYPKSAQKYIDKITERIKFLLSL